MRSRVALAAALLAGCGELSGAAVYSEVGPADTGARDTSAPPPDTSAPPGLNDLDGYYQEDIIPRTRAIYRLNRASDPGHPQIVFVSTNEAVTIPCETFKRADWSTSLPSGAIIHVIELGSTVPASYVVRRDTPPLVDGANVGRAVQTGGPLSLQRATKGSVTIDASDLTVSRGSLDVSFEVFYEPDPAPHENKVKGTFAAPACAVD